MEGQRGRIRDVAFLIALVLAAAVVATLVVMLVAQVSLHTLRQAAVPLLAASLAAAIAALLGWREERREGRHAEERDLLARTRLEDEAHGHDPITAQLEEKIAKLEAELAEEAGDHAELEELRRRLAREREAHARTERARRLEREWNRELREQVMHLHHERGMLGDTSDIRALVLHIAVTLLDAEKGMLLQRSGSNGSSRLEVTYSEGFESDPSESRLAQRFASEVIERDT